MAFLKKLFGGNDPLTAVSRAVRREQWADALREGEGTDKGNLNPQQLEELESLLEQASNRLAETNLDEGEACQRTGDLERAHEHYELARQHAQSQELKLRTEQLRQLIESPAPPIEASPVSAASCCSSGCGTPSVMAANPVEEMDDLDPETRFELVLSSYPPEWAARYADAGPEFKQALLMSHEDHLPEASAAFDTVAEENRDDLFYFERGALRVRMNEISPGRNDLERAIQMNPQHELALETLVALDLTTGNLDAAEARLQSMLQSDIEPAFCYSRLAMIATSRNDNASAMAFGQKSLALGVVDLDTLVLQSSLLERNERNNEAEALLATLPAGGCGGGAHVLLAEFWLRHNKNLQKALESFKGASRQEPANPRWPLRIAQTYLALGWHKEGQTLMRKLLNASALDEHLRQEAEESLVFYGK